MGTELPWRLQYAHGTPTLRSSSTVSRYSLHYLFKVLESSWDWFFDSHHTGEYSHCPHRVLGVGRLIGPQLHAAWVPAQNVCVVINTESTRKNVTATLVTDVVLLLIMLVGLLRMPQYGNMFGLWKILWRQVGNEVSFLL